MTQFFGLTGGIGSGKSTVANLFHRLGIPTLDLDFVGKAIIDDDPAIAKELMLTFGEGILRSDQTIDRTKLAKVAFSNAEKTQALNKIMHPRIKALENQWREQQVSPFAIIEASVLIESDDTKRMDGLIVVLSDLEIRKQRVLNRGNQSLEAFNQIIQRQCTDEMRCLHADFIFENNKSLQALEEQVQTFFLRYDR